MSTPTTQVVTIDLIPGNDANATGPDGVVRLTRTATGLQASVDGGAPAPVAGSGGAAVGSCGAWPAAQYDFIHALMPALTGFQYLSAGQLPQGATAVPSTSDGAVEGGGRTAANTGIGWLTASVFQTVKTGQGAFAFRARFLAASAGQTNAVGIGNAAGSHDLIVGALSGVSTTNYGLAADGTASDDVDLNVPNDLAFHDFVVTFDATDFKVYMDGSTTPVGTLAIGTLAVDEPYYLFITNTVSGETVWTDCLYGYVKP